jgi:hypothetical protein
VLPATLVYREGDGASAILVLQLLLIDSIPGVVISPALAY